MQNLLKPMVWTTPAILVLIALSLHVLSSDLTQLLEFDRSAIAQEQWWRLVTGHLLHTNHWHLLMNLAGFGVILLLHSMYYRPLYLALHFLLGSVLISIAMLLWSPDIALYVGLSGWLHALLITGCCFDIQRGWSSGWLIMVGVLVKIGWEQWQGASKDLVHLIDAAVATDAHLYGVVSGALLFFGLNYYQRFANGQKSPE